jgi:CRISPR-associated protein Cas2
MLELAAGVYSSPRLSAAVRERIWAVLELWWPYEKGASIVMVWADRSTPGGQTVNTLGTPPIDLPEIDGIVIVRRRPD